MLFFLSALVPLWRKNKMISRLKKIFEINPGKSTIEMKEKCSDCGREVIIKITPTSGGFGINGGVLSKGEAESTFMKCPDCNKLNSGKAMDEGRGTMDEGR